MRAAQIFFRTLCGRPCTVKRRVSPFRGLSLLAARFPTAGAVAAVCQPFGALSKQRFAKRSR
jgi:hypothetical protein